MERVGFVLSDKETVAEAPKETNPNVRLFATFPLGPLYFGSGCAALRWSLLHLKWPNYPSVVARDDAAWTSWLGGYYWHEEVVVGPQFRRNSFRTDRCNGRCGSRGETPRTYGPDWSGVRSVEGGREADVAGGGAHKGAEYEGAWWVAADNPRTRPDGPGSVGAHQHAAVYVYDASLSPTPATTAYNNK